MILDQTLTTETAYRHMWNKECDPFVHKTSSSLAIGSWQHCVLYMPTFLTIIAAFPNTNHLFPNMSFGSAIVPRRPAVLFILSCLTATFSCHAFVIVRPFVQQHRVAPFGIQSSVRSDFATNVAQSIHPQVAKVVPVGVRNITSQGTGFVVNYNDDEQYVYLLTAAHVASPGLGLTVCFPDATATAYYAATVVGRDIDSDVALIRFKTDNSTRTYQPLQLSLNETIPVGTLAFASGYPSGIVGGPAMTMGIVCGMAKGVSEWFGSSTATTTKANNDTSYTERNSTFVVTDAAMAGGMSGGPLVDVNGVVLGMNALIRPDMRALGNYAVSAGTCRAFINRLQEDEHISRSSLANNSSTTFRVMLYNDRMNKRTRVAQILKDVAALDEDSAEKVMMSAHTTGRGMVREFPGGEEGRTQAETFCNALRNEDVLVEVEQIKSY